MMLTKIVPPSFERRSSPSPLPELSSLSLGPMSLSQKRVTVIMAGISLVSRTVKIDPKTTISKTEVSPVGKIVSKS